MKNSAARIEPARRLDPAIELPYWLLRNKGMRRADLADALGVRRTAITLFIQGKMRSKRIREWFLSQGCPEELLPRAEDARQLSERRRQA